MKARELGTQGYVHTTATCCESMLQLKLSFTLTKTTYNEPCSVKMGLDSYAKSIDPCQPAQFAQADMGRNFSLSILNKSENATLIF